MKLETAMAKAKSSTGKSGGKSGPKSSGSAKINEALRDEGQKAAELAKNPVARSMLVGGMVTAAAAFPSSRKVREREKEQRLDLGDSREAAADSARQAEPAINNSGTQEHQQ